MGRSAVGHFGAKRVAFWGCALFAIAAHGQSAADSDQPAEDNGSRYWLSGQANFITQGHPDFRALYSGPNSLRPEGERKTSRVLTLFTGFRLATHTEILFDLEATGGGRSEERRVGKESRC